MSSLDPALLNHNGTALPDPTETNGPPIVAVAVICAVIASTFVALRFYARTRIIHVVSWEDWLLLAALVCLVGTCASIGIQVHFGLGRHTVYIKDHMKDNLLLSYIATTFYNFGNSFVKLSILCLYLRILTLDYARLMTQILLGIVLVTQLFIVTTFFTGNIPIQSFWDLTIPVVYTHPKPMFWACGGLHMSTDVLIFLLPIPVVLGLRVPRRQKLALCGIFTIGFGVVFISAYRLYRVISGNGFRDPDFTFHGTTTACLTCIEPCGAIVCASLTTLKPLAAKLWPRLFARPPRAVGAAGFELARHTISSGPPRVKTDTLDSLALSHSDALGLSEYDQTVSRASSNISSAGVDDGMHVPGRREHDYTLQDLEARTALANRYPGATVPLDDYHQLQEELASSARRPPRARHIPLMDAAQNPRARLV